MTACAPSGVAPEVGGAAVEPYAGSRIVWVDSHAHGHEGGATVEDGLGSVLGDSGIELFHVTMNGLDTESTVAAAVAGALAEIDEVGPDVIIATDDEVLRYLVAPELEGASIPVVFAAVTWAGEGYDHLAPNVTGMIQIHLVAQLVGLLSPHAEGSRIGYLGGDTPSQRRLTDAYNERFFDGSLETEFVSTFGDFQRAFIDSQETVDMLIIGDNDAIKGWDPTVAAAFALENTGIPTGSFDAELAPIVMLTLASPGREQGEWAAATALQILDGTPVSSIPIAQSHGGRLIVNTAIAGRLLVEFPPAVLRNAEVYREGPAT